MKISLCLIPILALAQAPSGAPATQIVDSIIFQTSVPPTPSCSSGVVGAPGTISLYYWPVANYPQGQAVASNPIVVVNANSTLTSGNYVQVNCQVPAGATTVDLLKTTTPSLSIVGTASVAVGTTSTTGIFQDQGGALSSYTFNTIPTGFYGVRLNNKSYTSARLEWGFGTNPGTITYGPLRNIDGGNNLGVTNFVDYETTSPGVTLAQLNAGITLVAGIPGRTLRIKNFFIVARGGAVAGCTDVRLGDSNNGNVSVIDPVANLTQNAGNTPATSTITQTGFGSITGGAGLGINLFKTGASCTTATTFDVILHYSII